MNQLYEELLAVTELTLQFGRVNRATLHPDGIRPESDTDHTVMLALVCLTTSSHLALYLNPSRILLFALVHDLPEAYCGDTNTLCISADDRALKAEREVEALLELRKKLPQSFIPKAIDAYEMQDVPESRFVKLVDKIMPKLTHQLNGCEAFFKLGKSAADIKAAHTAQYDDLHKKYGEEFPKVLTLLKTSMDATFATYCSRGGE